MSRKISNVDPNANLTLVDALAQDDDAPDVEFEPPRFGELHPTEDLALLHARLRELGVEPFTEGQTVTPEMIDALEEKELERLTRHASGQVDPDAKP